MICNQYTEQLGQENGNLVTLFTSLPAFKQWYGNKEIEIIDGLYFESENGGILKIEDIVNYINNPELLFRKGTNPFEKIEESVNLNPDRQDVEAIREKNNEYKAKFNSIFNLDLEVGMDTPLSEIMKVPTDVKDLISFSEKLGFNGILLHPTINVKEMVDYIEEKVKHSKVNINKFDIDKLNWDLPNQNELLFYRNIKEIDKENNVSFFDKIIMPFRVLMYRVLLENLKAKFNVNYQLVKNVDYIGKFEDGVVKINIDKINAKSIFHEFLHPFILALKKDNPILYTQLLNHQDVSKMKHILNQFIEYREYADEEALVRVIENGLKEPTLKDYIKLFIEWIKGFIFKATEVNIDNLNITLDDFNTLLLDKNKYILNQSYFKNIQRLKLNFENIFTKRQGEIDNDVKQAVSRLLDLHRVIKLDDKGKEPLIKVDNNSYEITKTDGRVEQYTRISSLVQFNGDKDSEYVKNAQEIGTQFHSVAEVVINHMIENDIEINDTKNLKQLTDRLLTDLKTKLDGFLTDADLFYNDNEVHKTELRKSIINSVLKSFIFILDDIEGDSLNNLFVMTEFTSYSNEYAGTQDLVAIYKDKKGILQVKIIDYKTSKLKYNEETIQKKYAEKNNYYKELFENILAGIVEPDNIQTVISLIKANTILSLDLIELEKDGESITIKEYLESKLEEGEVLEFLSEKTGEETYYTLGKMTDEGGKTYSALFYKVKGEPNERMDIDFIAYVKKGYLIQSFKHESDTIIKYSLNPKKTLLESKDRQAYYQLLVLKKLLETNRDTLKEIAAIKAQSSINERANIENKLKYIDEMLDRINTYLSNVASFNEKERAELYDNKTFFDFYKLLLSNTHYNNKNMNYKMNRERAVIKNIISINSIIKKQFTDYAKIEGMLNIELKELKESVATTPEEKFNKKFQISVLEKRINNIKTIIKSIQEEKNRNENRLQNTLRNYNYVSLMLDIEAELDELKRLLKTDSINKSFEDRTYFIEYYTRKLNVYNNLISDLQGDQEYAELSQQKIIINGVELSFLDYFNSINNDRIIPLIDELKTHYINVIADFIVSETPKGIEKEIRIREIEVELKKIEEKLSSSQSKATWENELERLREADPLTVEREFYRLKIKQELESSSISVFFEDINEKLFSSDRSNYRLINIFGLLNKKVNLEVAEHFAKYSNEIQDYTIKFLDGSSYTSGQYYEEFKDLIAYTKDDLTIQDFFIQYGDSYALEFIITDHSDRLLIAPYVKNLKKNLYEGNSNSVEIAAIRQIIIENDLITKYNSFRTNTLIDWTEYDYGKEFNKDKNELLQLIRNRSQKEVKVRLEEYELIEKKVIDTYKERFRLYDRKDDIKLEHLYAKEYLNYLQKIKEIIENTGNSEINLLVKLQSEIDNYKNLTDSDRANLKSKELERLRNKFGDYTDIMIYEVEKRMIDYFDTERGYLANAEGKIEYNKKASYDLIKNSGLDEDEKTSKKDGKNIEIESKYNIELERLYKTTNPFSFRFIKNNIETKNGEDIVKQFIKTSLGKVVVSKIEIMNNEKKITKVLEDNYIPTLYKTFSFIYEIGKKDERFEEVLNNPEKWEYYKYIRSLVQNMYYLLPFSERADVESLDLPYITKDIGDKLSERLKLNKIKGISNPELNIKGGVMDRIRFNSNEIMNYLKSQLISTIVDPNDDYRPTTKIKPRRYKTLMELRRDVNEADYQIDNMMQLYIFDILTYKARTQQLPISNSIINLIRESSSRNANLRDGAEFQYRILNRGSYLKNVTEDNPDLMTESTREAIRLNRHQQDKKTIQITELEYKINSLYELSKRKKKKEKAEILFKAKELSVKKAILVGELNSLKNQEKALSLSNKLDADDVANSVTKIYRFYTLSWGLINQINNLAIGLFNSLAVTSQSDKELKAYQESLKITGKASMGFFELVTGYLLGTNAAQFAASMFGLGSILGIPLIFISGFAGIWGFSKGKEYFYKNRETTMNPDLEKALNITNNLNITFDTTEEANSGIAPQRNSDRKNKKESFVDMMKPYSYIKKAEFLIALQNVITQTKLTMFKIGDTEISYFDMCDTEGNVKPEYAPYITQKEIEVMYRQIWNRLQKANGDYTNKLRFEQIPMIGKMSLVFMKWIPEPFRMFMGKYVPKEDNLMTNEPTEGAIRSMFKKGIERLYTVFKRQALMNTEDTVDVLAEYIWANRKLPFNFDYNLESRQAVNSPFRSIVVDKTIKFSNHLFANIVSYRRGLIYVNDSQKIEFLHEIDSLIKSYFEKNPEANIAEFNTLISELVKKYEIRILKTLSDREMKDISNHFVRSIYQFIMPFDFATKNRNLDGKLNYVVGDIEDLDDYALAQRKGLRIMMSASKTAWDLLLLKIFMTIIFSSLQSLFGWDDDDFIAKKINFIQYRYRRLWEDSYFFLLPHNTIYKVKNSVAPPITFMYNLTRLIPDVLGSPLHFLNNHTFDSDTIDELLETVGIDDYKLERSTGVTNNKLINDFIKLIPAFNKTVSEYKQEDDNYGRNQ